MSECNWPDCTAEGEFPAPVDPRNLRARQHLCAEHIKVFNKQWNGLKGFSDTEINALHDTAITWLRGTRPIGENPTAAADLHFETADELRKFFEKRNASKAKTTENGRKMPPDVQDACALFGLDKPLEGSELKKHYLKLMKQHHPDKHEGAKEAEEFVKKLNIAFQILQTWPTQQAA